MESPLNHKRRAHGALFIATIVATGSVAINAAIPGALGIEAAFNLAAGSGARLIGTFVTGYALGHVWVGLFARNLPQKTLLTLGLCGFVFTSVWIAMAAHPEILAWIRGFQGFFASVCPIIGRALVRQLGSSRYAAKRMSAASALFTWAPVFAPLLAGWLADQYDWRMIYFALAVYGSLCLGWVLSIPAGQFGAPDNASRSWGDQWQRLADLARDPACRAGLVSGALVFSGFFSFLAVSPNLQADWSAAPLSLAAVVALFAAGYALGAAASRLALNYMDETRVLLVSLALMITASVALAVLASLAVHLVGFVACAFVYAMAAGAAMPNATVLAMRHSTRLAPLALAVLGVSKLMLAAMVTFLTTRSGLPAPVSASAIMFIAALGALLILRTPRVQNQNEAA